MFYNQLKLAFSLSFFQGRSFTPGVSNIRHRSQNGIDCQLYFHEFYSFPANKDLQGHLYHAKVIH